MPGGMPPEVLWWDGVQLGQTPLNALGSLRSDRLAQRKGGGECVGGRMVGCREPCSVSHQCRSHMTNQMDVIIKMRGEKNLI